LLVDPS